MNEEFWGKVIFGSFVAFAGLIFIAILTSCATQLTAPSEPNWTNSYNGKYEGKGFDYCKPTPETMCNNFGQNMSRH